MFCLGNGGEAGFCGGMNAALIGETGFNVGSIWLPVFANG